MEELQLALLIQMGLRALNHRILTLVSVLCSMGLFCWAMFDPDWRRITAASLGGIIFWCLVNLKGKDHEARLHETTVPHDVPVWSSGTDGNGSE